MAREIVSTIDNKKDNLIINGAADFFQRSTSVQPLTTGNQYLGPDRWLVSQSGGITSPVVQRGSIPGAVAGPEGRYNIRFSGTVAPGGGFVARQRIEARSVRFLSDGNSKVSLSFYIWSDGPEEVEIRLAYANAEDDWTSNTIFHTDTETLTTIGSWQKVTFNDISVPSDVNVGMELTIISKSVSFSGATASRITDVMLNEGSVAAPFQRAGETVEGELALCQRYYYTGVHTVHQYCSTASFERYRYPTHYPVAMRAVPSVSSTVSSSAGVRSPASSFFIMTGESDKTFQISMEANAVAGTQVIGTITCFADAEL